MYQTLDRPTLGQLIVPAVLTADNTPLAVDLRGFQACGVLLSHGAGGITFTTTNKIEFVLRHGDTATVANHTAVAATDVALPSGQTWATGGIIRSFTAAVADAGVIYLGDYVGTKRYISLLADFSGTHGVGTALSATAYRSRAAAIG
ncbi:MAG: hypothetical protein EBS23_05975 [Betaproteobacteria bacterium]|jgi:hypothetical protein|nr:hypothetical protein [Betaproteobacteria bacterium]